ncbi:hypothetical protein [Pseudomonas aeruginosa]|uniref:hypothetical protein n=1 Tax=Pseudomonas aeruginosa TaxID=287 RepID=UPI0023599165|nr:hypothetical protein KK180_24630 [Pseudomonas aeruginosa]
MASSLAPRQVIRDGQFITSPNGKYKLVMQADGNLVLYEDGTKPIWNTTPVGPGAKAVMEFNLNLYNKAGQVAWSSNVYTAYLFEEFKDEAYLNLQDDGDFGIFSDEAKWGAIVLSRPEVGVKNKIIPTGTVMVPGTEYINGNYRLAFQGDGNLVIYQISPQVVIWATYTMGADRAVVQEDGNFVIYKGTTALWHTHTATGMPAYLKFTNTGKLFLSQPTLLWTLKRGSLSKPPKVIPGQHGPLDTTPIWSWPHDYP